MQICESKNCDNKATVNHSQIGYFLCDDCSAILEKRFRKPNRSTNTLL